MKNESCITCGLQKPKPGPKWSNTRSSSANLSHWDKRCGNTTGLVSQYKNEIIGAGTLQQYDYDYNASGSITSITDGLSGQVTHYGYDGLNRLISESSGGATTFYVYDAGGNLTVVEKNGVVTDTYTYGNANWPDQLTAKDGVPISYDAMGNLTEYAGHDFTWTRGRLLGRVEGPGQDIHYAYDASGRLTRITNNGAVTDLTYSGSLLMRQRSPGHTLEFQYDASGTAVGFNHNGTPYFYLRNLQGDIITITDRSGTVVATYAYDAWGNLLSAIGPMADINPIRYRGYYADNIFGWYWLQTRWYVPQWGRFLNADCLFITNGDALSGSNMYAYCRNNPVMRIDPTGMADNPIVNAILFFTFIAPVYYMITQTVNSFSLSDSQVANGLSGFISTMVGLGATASDIVEFLGNWAANLGLMERPEAGDAKEGFNWGAVVKAGLIAGGIGVVGGVGAFLLLTTAPITIPALLIAGGAGFAGLGLPALIARFFEELWKA